MFLPNFIFYFSSVVYSSSYFMNKNQTNSNDHAEESKKNKNHLKPFIHVKMWQNFNSSLVPCLFPGFFVTLLFLTTFFFSVLANFHLFSSKLFLILCFSYYFIPLPFYTYLITSFLLFVFFLLLSLHTFLYIFISFCLHSERLIFLVFSLLPSFHPESHKISFMLSILAINHFYTFILTIEINLSSIVFFFHFQ